MSSEVPDKQSKESLELSNSEAKETGNESAVTSASIVDKSEKADEMNDEDSAKESKSIVDDQKETQASSSDDVVIEPDLETTDTNEVDKQKEQITTEEHFDNKSKDSLRDGELSKAEEKEEVAESIEQSTKSPLPVVAIEEDACETSSANASTKDEQSPEEIKNLEENTIENPQSNKEENEKEVTEEEMPKSTTAIQNDATEQNADVAMEVDQNPVALEKEEAPTLNEKQEEEDTANSSKPVEEILENVEEEKQSENAAMEVDEPPVDQPSEESSIALEDNQPKVEQNEQSTELIPTAESEVETHKPKEDFIVSMDVDEDESLLDDASKSSLVIDERESDMEDTTTDVYTNKECINYECPRKHKQYYKAPVFVMSYYNAAKKKKKLQYVCVNCYDEALEMYEENCSLLRAKQPLLLQRFGGGDNDFVEIIDSSEEDENDEAVADVEEHEKLSAKDRDLVENELEGIISQVLHDVDIQNQLTWSKTLLSTRVKKLEAETNYIDASLRTLQKKADKMHVSLYQCPRIKIRQLQPLDLNSGRTYVPTEGFVPQLPPVGDIERPPIQMQEFYYAVKNKAIASWVPCRVLEEDALITMAKGIKQYKVKFLKYQVQRTVSLKHLAYYEPPKVRLPIGTRVIAYFDATSLSRCKEKIMVQSAFYPGIIAEPLKPNNKYRYLVFYDDGYTQYVYHHDVRLVCQAADKVWEDVHPGSRDFIQTYLTQYCINRPMVQTQRGQSMLTESKGKWIHARVVDIDCSLIQMQFEGAKSQTEWIYRGSMRLGPVFKEHQKSLQKDVMPVSRVSRRTEPFIRYTDDEEITARQQTERGTGEVRAVAKKRITPRTSSSSAPATPTPAVPVRHLNNSTIYVDDEAKPRGRVHHFTTKRSLPPQSFKPHECSPSCLYMVAQKQQIVSPIARPLLCGWERLIFRQKIKKVITYRTPCGKMMRNMKELRDYLRVTENSLNVDNFDFSPDINCLAEFVVESAVVKLDDISEGRENVPISLANDFDMSLPPPYEYAAQRIPTEGVHINIDSEFLVGCDCEDDCMDKEKCLCWHLTLEGAKYGNAHQSREEFGYQFKRLGEPIPTGVYECNSRCKCKSNCVNRVAQQPMQTKLQVFKTCNRGWGLRCLNDIPKGSFICIYAGNILTESNANKGGLDAGDEYFAELDYIEVAEQLKENYESDVEEPEIDDDDDEEDVYRPKDDDDEFNPGKAYTRAKRNQRSSRSSQNIDDDSQERQVINFNPNADMNEDSLNENSVRRLFGRDELCYVMDAKTIGNLGRYFNHSCSPNLFVQNVFVDTHDLRFPWVAFFAFCNIKAGSELTWNYNYEVGVVPGKVLYCQCGAPNCRIRLL